VIGRITGVILEKRLDQVLVDVGGLAYEVEIPLTTFERLGESADRVILHTHLVVREDAQQLFGFYTEKERDLFRSLIKVNGVGPRMALTIQSSVDSDTFVRCIRDNDVKTLVALPGIGKKKAERLIIEMQDRLPDWQLEEELKPAYIANQDIVSDAESALIGMGYKPQEAAMALAGLDDTSVEELIRVALKRLVGGKLGVSRSRK
jgi:Holliday junction DNA helicase RuvA